MITHVRKKGGHHVVFHAEKHRKRLKYFGKSQITFPLVTFEKMKKCENTSKPLWARKLRMLGKNEDHHVIFQAEKNGKRHEYSEKVKKQFFLGTLMRHLAAVDL